MNGNVSGKAHQQHAGSVRAGLSATRNDDQGRDEASEWRRRHGGPKALFCHLPQFPDRRTLRGTKPWVNSRTLAPI